MNNEKVLFIINKFAGGGFQSKLEGKILDVCARHNAECTIEFTREKGNATELAREGVAQGYRKIIAVGGDGTVNEVAKGLLHTDVALGIVPKGSGNGLARHLRLPLVLERAVENIFVARSVIIDTFTLNGHLSLNVSGVGFDGHVANQFGKDGKRGLIGYTHLTIKEFTKFAEFAATLSIDGKTWQTNAFIIAIANSSQYGNNARIVPIASVTDGELHVAIIKKVPLVHSPAFIARFLSNNLERSFFYKVFSGKHIEISITSPCPYHIDGEAAGMDHSFVATIAPASLNILVPSTSSII
jgi:YegS/Rv2252/BmrU family lipid kinase